MKFSKETKIGLVVGFLMLLLSLLLEYSYFWITKFWFIKKSFSITLDGVLLPSILGLVILAFPTIYGIIVIRKHKDKLQAIAVTLFIFAILCTIPTYYLKYEHYFLWAARGQMIVDLILFGRSQGFIIAETILNTWFLFLLSSGGLFILSCILILQKPKIIDYVKKGLQRIKKYPKNPKLRWWIWLLGIALILRVVWILLVPSKPVRDFAVYDGFATRLTQGLGYVTENGIRTAYWPVGYPLFLSFLYRIFGYSLTIAKISSVILSLATVSLTFLLGKHCLSEKAGKIAALIVALLPVQIFYANLLSSENLFTPVLLLLIYFLIKPKEKLFAFLIIGIFSGIASLIRPVALSLPVIFLIYFLINKKKTMEIIKHFSLILAGIIIILLPWMIRNYCVFKEVIPVSTNGGVNFFIGNNEHATGRYSIQCSRNIPGKTELERNSLGYSKGLEFILKNPGKFFVNGLKKIYFLYGGEMISLNWSFATVYEKENIRILAIYITQATYLLLLFATIIGLITWIRNYDPRFLLFVMIIILWTLIHFMFFGEDRYHLPLIPLFTIFAVKGSFNICRIKK